MVLVSVLLLAVLSTYRDRKNSSPQGTFRTFWGVGVVGFMLSLLADFVPQIAGPFAGLAVLGSLTNGGWDVIQKGLGFVAAPPAPRSGSSSPPGPGSSSTTAPAPSSTAQGGIQR